MMGHPEETIDDFRQTIAFLGDLLRLECVVPQLHWLAPLAGTPLTLQYRDRLLLDGFYSDLAGLGTEPHAEDVRMISAYPDLFPNFYALPCPLDREYLRELWEFLANSFKRCRSLLSALHLESGDLLKVFDDWKRWRPVPACVEDYYRCSLFCRDFMRFALDAYEGRDDWIQAGMHLGIFRNPAVFLPEGAPNGAPLQFTDSAGDPHCVVLLDLPRREMGYGGRLVEGDRRDDILWRVLGWDEREGRYWFRSPGEPLALDFDLDCFAVEAGEYRFPWCAEMFEGEFLAPSSHPATEGRTGAEFVAALAERARLLTFAAEPRHCGDGLDPGPKAGRIFDSVNAFLFGGRLFSRL
jgi:hypothetical protein